jgi:single-strand DNA-binding protein
MAGKSLNKVTLIGHVGKDPEVRYTNSGVAVASFTLATNDRRKDKSGEWTEHTEWHSIVVWDKLAEICSQYAKKGKQIYLEGRLQTRDWDDKDGNKRKTTEIVASDVILLGGGGGQGGGEGYQRSGGSNYGGGTRQTPSAPSLPEPDFEPAPADDLPF